jgi:bifunctional non-homologous end joining protein LigD
VKSLLARLEPALRRELRRASLPAWISPMLATLSEEVPPGPGWLFEPKFDGIRCLTRILGGRAELWSRNRKRLTASFPEIAAALDTLELGDMWLDGELIAVRGRRHSFGLMQQRVHVQAPSAELLRAVPVRYWLFDLLHFEDRDLTMLPLSARKELLRAAVPFGVPIHLTPHWERGGEARLRAACKRGEEGLIAKRRLSAYHSRRSREWLKVKCARSEEFVVGGFTAPRGTRVALGALLVGQYVSGKLRFAGKVGTGLATATLRQLRATLEEIESPRSPFDPPAGEEPGVRWVEPRMVVQVAFSERTRDGRLRHPRFLGIRTDKRPEEARPERTVRPRRAARTA